MITIDSILEDLAKGAEDAQVFSPHQYVEASARLNALLGNEHDKYWLLRQEVAKQKAILMENGDSAAKAQTKMEATDLFVSMRRQEARIEIINEHIKIAKKMATLKSEELRGGSINV